MKTLQLKVARIGNSRGVRIPARTLDRYRIGESVIMEERPEGILLRPRKDLGAKLSWEDTARDMAAAGENWTEWDDVLADGLESVPWSGRKSARVAESSAKYSTARGKKERTRK